jgi:hypothetical protein
MSNISKTFTLDKVKYTSAVASGSSPCSGCVADGLGCNEGSLCQALPDCVNIVWVKDNTKEEPVNKILKVSTTSQMVTVKQYTLTLTEDQINEIYGLICDSDGGVFLSDLQREIEML